MQNIREISFWFALVLLAVWISGCGETIRGLGKDTSRIYRGTKTVFVSGS